jgi:hypothetical protein
MGKSDKVAPSFGAAGWEAQNDISVSALKFSVISVPVKALRARCTANLYARSLRLREDLHCATFPVELFESSYLFILPLDPSSVSFIWSMIEKWHHLYLLNTDC